MIDLFFNMPIEYNVVSLFDGISCGQQTLRKMGKMVSRYYASEIDKHAIVIAKKNFPKTKHIGDVTLVRGDQFKKPIHLLIGGSPCQGFSFAGKQLNFDDPRSKLFFEYVRVRDELLVRNPRMKWMLENVMMKKEYIDVISGYLGVEPIMINSNLVSAQNRKRLYWTNIEGIEHPADRGIYLEDIIEQSCTAEHTLSEKAIFRAERKKGYNPRLLPSKTGTLNTENNSSKMAFDAGTTLIPYILDIGVYQFPHGGSRGGIRLLNKSPAVILNLHQNYFKIVSSEELLKWVCSEFENRRPIDLKEFLTSVTYAELKKYGVLRKLTPTECEKLQGLPPGYTFGIHDKQRYKALGNGWQIDTIAHIFSYL